MYIYTKIRFIISFYQTTITRVSLKFIDFFFSLFLQSASLSLYLYPGSINIIYILADKIL